MKRTMQECVICEQEFYRPPNLLISHRAEGIQIYAICSKESCWISLGRKMVKGNR